MLFRSGRCDEQLRRAEQDELVARCIVGDFRVLLRGATREVKCIYQPAIVVNDRNVSAYEEEFSFGVIEMCDELAGLESCVQGCYDWLRSISLSGIRSRARAPTTTDHPVDPDQIVGLSLQDVPGEWSHGTTP